MPETLSKSDIRNMVPDKRDKILEYSERWANEWLQAFFSELKRINNFFNSKQDDLINDFIILQDKFRIKTDYHIFERGKEKGEV